jgi:hypothetical protein
MGPLGGLLTNRLYDDKIMSQDEYKFDGVKGGDQWKGRCRRYFMAKVPALRVLMAWCESADDKTVTREHLLRAVQGQMTEEQLDTINAAVWGFLSGCLSSEAEAVFKRAEELNGFDAWRRVCRYIDHGRGIRLEALRAEVRSIHLHPMKNLEAVALGIAQFENKLSEYEDAGGKRPDDHERKADLLAILPQELRENLLGRAADDGAYEPFRDMVQAQAAKILLTRRKLPIHSIEDDTEVKDKLNALDDILAALRGGDQEQLIGAFNRATGKPRGAGGRFQRSTAPPARQQPPTAGAGPRCPNCGDRHLMAKCPHPVVETDKRKCWTCGKVGCVASRCPEKKKYGSRPLRALEDAPLEFPYFGCLMSEPQSEYALNALKDNLDDGFAPVKRGTRPRPHGATLGDFVVRQSNNFSVLANNSDHNSCECECESSRALCQKQPLLLKVSLDEFNELVVDHGFNQTLAMMNDNGQSNDSTTITPLSKNQKKNIKTKAMKQARFDALMQASIDDDIIDQATESRAQASPRDAPRALGAPASSCLLDSRQPLPQPANGPACHPEATQSSIDGHVCQTEIPLSGVAGRYTSTPDAFPPLGNDGRGSGSAPLLTKAAEPKPSRDSSQNGCSCSDCQDGGRIPQVKSTCKPLETYLLEDEILIDDILGGMAEEQIKMKVTLDSGAVANVMNMEQVPRNVKVQPNTTGKHFVGPGGEKILNHGTCETQLETGKGKIGCKWKVADVTRSLHAVTQIAGPPGAPAHDILFNNEIGVVVPHGIVNEILKKVKPIAEYHREGNLYCATMTVSDFHRQGPNQ